MDAYVTVVAYIALLLSLVECQITSKPEVKEPSCAKTNVDLEWVYGNSADVISVSWTYIDDSLAEKVIMQYNGVSATVVDDFNVVHNSNNGGITLTKVNKGNSGSYKITVTYISTPPVEDTVNVTVEECKIPTPPCPSKCEPCAIVCALFGILALIDLVVAFVGYMTKLLKKKVALVLIFVCIALAVISIIVGIVVKTGDCDKDCCADWIGGLALAFIIISAIELVLAIVFLIFLKNNWGPFGKGGGRPGGNGPNGGGGPGDNGNNGGGTDRIRSRVHAEPNETHVALTNRTDSDSAVSRQDVHVQENKGHLSARPMPPIPLRQEHDKKGRGLSATFGDDHPMVGVDTPEKKAGDLGPLPEEQQKKKKNKKKKKRTEEDDEE